MSNNKAFKVKNGLELSDYNKSISDTAVDIFVYDTRKDSDGGAWRKRTQHTSWYNETLNTATRGSRKEFPAVAVIVAETAQVTIYDGDDPDLPMWMVFDATVSSPKRLVNLNTPSVIKATTALNGIVSVATGDGSTGGGFTVIGFVADIGELYFEGVSPDQGYYLYNGPISTRNDSLGHTKTDGNTRIVNNLINDVAMTVLPNAPIDAATGLPVPTIAVATNGGVSVIKDDGTVVDSTTTTEYANVAFASNDMWATDKAFSDEIRYFENVSGLVDGFTHDFTYWGGSVTTNSNSGLPQPWWDNGSSVYDEFAVTDYGIAARQHSNGFFALSPDATHKNGLGAYIASDYNTGWMNGDIKLATLSDTDATNVTGSEITTDGTFSDTANWTEGDAAWSVTGGALVGTSVPNNKYTGQSITSVPSGTLLTAVVTVSSYTSGNLNFALRNVQDGVNEPPVSFGVNGTGTFSATIRTTQANAWLEVLSSGTTTMTIDDISVRLAEEDRSVNGNGLQVFGTVTKSAVASGADLVAYSGFSSSNYLQQPYNSDLDFGTGDFCVMGWYKTSNTTAANEILFARVDSGNVAAINLLITSSETITLQTRESSTSSTVTTTETAPTGVWNCFVFVRRNSGTVQEIYINGKLSLSGTVTARNVSSSTGKVYMGYTPELASNAKGFMALWRISATAPSPEQILKTYNDEKVLFQDNAQATLYGSSDAVTALAYDDSNGILSVGTSAGRSDFQGLRRVNNTTNAVGAAISASNGMIVEE